MTDNVLEVSDNIDEIVADKDGKLAKRLNPYTQRKANPMHPTGRCMCSGEGKCDWCREHCGQCGATVHMSLDERYVRTPEDHILYGLERLKARDELRFDLVAHLTRQREWSRQTFGPAPRTEGVLGHIEKELQEVRENPDDLFAWIDVIILALDGAWRQGHEPEAIVQALIDKQARNERRKWPNWQTQSENATIEHVHEIQPGARCSNGCEFWCLQHCPDDHAPYAAPGDDCRGKRPRCSDHCR